MSERRPTGQMKAFALLVFQTNEPTESYMAAYRCKSRRGASASACKLLTKPNIQTILQELRQKAEDAAIMDVKERKERLSEMGRGKVTDFMTTGADGTWIDIGPENPKAGAIQEVTSKTEVDDNENQMVITRVKLHDPVRAIAELNKMEHVYETAPTVNVDNRKVEVTVVTPEAQALLERVMNGEGTEGTEGE